jgi:hypothetical protein
VNTIFIDKNHTSKLHTEGGLGHVPTFVLGTDGFRGIFTSLSSPRKCPEFKRNLPSTNLKTLIYHRS